MYDNFNGITLLFTSFSYFCAVRPKYVTETYLDRFISEAIEEDIREGDHSTLSTIPAESTGKAQLLIKENGVIAGLELAEKVFHTLDSALKLDYFKSDGDQVQTGEVALEVHGHVRAILSAERLVLNLMQRMSGIATYTDKLCRLVQDTHATILDTRKTTPNLRPLEKWAVLLGGGTNHRIGLYDMIMLKDNHNDYAGGITNAVKNASNYLRENELNLKIEVETRTLEEVQEALNTGHADIIMLDNMDTETMKKAVEIIGGKAKTEASGGITETNILEMAQTGVDFISIGALTHSVKSLDISLKAEIDTAK